MRTLIIYAHPRTEGHCSYILQQVKSVLKSKKIDHDIIDLYGIRYDPILRENEHYTAGNRDVSKQNKDFQKKISDSNLLIFIYPVWWGSMPAILKGFFDRVLTSHYAFKYEGSIPKGLLKGKKAIVFITAGGPRIPYLFMLDFPKQVVKHIILQFCGIKTKAYMFFKCSKLDDKKKEKISEVVEKALGKI